MSFVLLRALRDEFLEKTSMANSESQPVPIAGDRQLFLDELIVERLEGARLKMHEPVPREAVLRLDRPWEGRTSWCPVVLKDGDRYRMWYRAQTEGGAEETSVGHSFTAYAESVDGIGWERPSLGIVEFNGSKENNICIHSPNLKNVAVFKDGRSGVSDDERYKAVGRWVRGSPSRIYGMVSPDGVGWRMAQEDPLIVAPESDPYFDSPLSAFWDTRRGCYVIYVRGWFPDGPDRRIRAIRMAASPDFVHWEPWRYIRIEGDAEWKYHLYTNAGHPYYRAPYILMFPKRFLPERRFLEDWPHEGLSDVVLLASRNGLHFSQPCREAFLRPGRDLKNWHERAIFIGPRAVPTGDGELSLYSVQNYRTDSIHIRRFTLREDGFTSIHAGAEGGVLLTRPLLFEGSRLQINTATSAAGAIRVALVDGRGEAIPGFSVEDSCEIFGDEIERTVGWKGGADVGALSGRPVRLRFEMADADLFSFRFQ